MTTPDADRPKVEVATSAVRLGLFEWDMARDTISWAGEQVHEILGIGPGERPPQDRAGLLALAERAEDRALLRQAIRGAEGGGALQACCRIRRRTDGAWRWIALQGRPGSAQPLRLIGALSDVTAALAGERMRAEQPAAAPASETGEQLQLAVRATGLGIFDWDLLTDQLRWSERTRQIFDLPAQASVTLETFFSRLHPDDRDRVAEAVRTALDAASSGDFQTEYRVCARDGSVRWIDARGQVYFAVRGGVRHAVRFVGAVLNVTERKASEQALREQRERLAVAMSAGRMGAWEWNLSTGACYWSDAMHEIFGVPPAAGAPQGDALLDCVHPDDRAHWCACLEQAERGGRYECEYRVVHPSGAVRWVQAQGSVLHDPHTAAPRLVGVCQDVSERKHAEQALREADARKDEFLAMLAHELRNPLAPLTNALRLLEHEVAGERGGHMLQIAGRQVRQLTRLVDDLLEVSRITQGRIALKCEPMAVVTAVDDAIESVRPIVEARKQTLLVGAPDPSPQVTADAARLAQVLENLLTNASKYTDEGGTIRVDIERDDEDVLIHVSDTGIGIDAEALPRVFDLFTQVDSTIDRSQGGLGIGLALVKRLVELHGGTVAAHSAGKNRGARFTVRLPCGCVDCAHCRGAATPGAAASGAVSYQ